MPTGSLLDRLARLDTNTVSDALDFLGLPGATVGLQPHWASPKLVGRAGTVQLGRKTGVAPTVHLISPVIARAEADDRVLVIAGGVEFGERIARRQDAMVAAVRAGRSVEDVMHDKEFEAIKEGNAQ